MTLKHKDSLNIKKLAFLLTAFFFHSYTHKEEKKKKRRRGKAMKSIISITTSNFADVKRKHLCILCLLEYTACSAFTSHL